MSHDERWREQVRAALRGPDDSTTVRATGTIATTAIDQGTARIAARASTRVAMMGALVVGVCAFAAWRWSEVEATRTAEASLIREASWIP